MEIKKQFTFSGVFKKFHETDILPVKIHNANIICCTNGNIWIEIDSEKSAYINHKRFRESAPIYQAKELKKEVFDSLLLGLHFLEFDEQEQEIVQQPYKGDYEIEGQTIEGWKINAIISDSNLKVSFKADNYQNTEREGKCQVNLRDLCIQYNLELIGKGETKEIVYGLANIEVIRQFSANIGNLEAEIYIESVSTTENRNKNGLLSVEMTLKNICEDKQISYKTYAAWFISLLSFASGHRVEQMYRIETANYEKSKIKREYWSGEKFNSEATGRAVIQSPHLPIFIQHCAKKMTWETFSDKGLSLELRWYINTFDSNMCEVNFLLFCTVLESLNKKYFNNVSRRPILRENRDPQEKNLQNSLKKMLENYGVPYQDLFPDLEFTRTRNKIVHEGFSEIHVNISIELQKLSNLIVRIFLSILDYQGDYMESVKIEIDDKSGCSHHGLICRRFPLINTEDSTV
ncbi:hypothetical protein [Chamaesiphon sp. VAR_48_metabat_135_sub]|uniref:hypothetical protein n=1 Tax=Chamaesiphon sp. VAR_48_metabat_135_sub TaxID=2964699 RepID=UPI00286D2284|nr:hypothetical protein [Chamaesiphon sp. VAR_48_metabat_135_sub]